MVRQPAGVRPAGLRRALIAGDQLSVGGIFRVDNRKVSLLALINDHLAKGLVLRASRRGREL